MVVVFRADASIEMGAGHIMRCLTLAQALKESGSSVKFICRKHRGNMINKIRSKGFVVHELNVSNKANVDDRLAHHHWLGATQKEDAEDCIKTLKERKPDWVIQDHYALDEEWQNALKPYYERLMVIDDLADRRHQCDVLLDQTFGRSEEDYLALVPGHGKLLLGSQYALIMSDFLKWRPYSLARRAYPKFDQLFINMGGVDADNVTEKVLDELIHCDLKSDFRVVIVLGSSNPHIESVKLKAKVLPCRTVVECDIDNMAEVMANSDIAIGAAGSTTWERCCLGLPTIQIVIAKNQVIIAQNLAKFGAIKLLKNMSDISKIINNSASWMSNVSNIASHVSDGLGVGRVVSVIMSETL